MPRPMRVVEQHNVKLDPGFQLQTVKSSVYRRNCVADNRLWREIDAVDGYHIPICDAALLLDDDMTFVKWICIRASKLTTTLHPDHC